MWKTDNIDGGLRHYSYDYDALNRFTRAYYAENDKYTAKFNSYVYNYDRNGNIGRILRYMINPSNIGFGIGMDNLTYTYDSGNKLLSVKDAYGLSTNGEKGFKDGNTVGNDYGYDLNGNLTIDKNKGITNITYNHLNLPTNIAIDDNSNEQGNISYVYDATGIKLKKIVDNYSSNYSETIYSGSYIYNKSGETGPELLQFYIHPEGYLETDGNEYNYVYQYKDHLGNVRLSYNDSNGDGKVLGATTEIFFDGFESASGWDGSGNSWGFAITDFDANFKFFGDYSGYIDRSSGNATETAVHSNDWVAINNSQPTDYIVSAWVYLENVVGNGADIYLFMKTNEETGYATAFDYYRTQTKGKWIYLEKRITVATEIKKLNVRIDNNGNGDVWFDNVSIRRLNPEANIEIVEENNYYPFGLEHKGYNYVINGTEHPNKFNNKEYNQELGLDWYDFGARNYDASLGRWMNIDPLAEEMRRHSPYNYAFNNPLRFIDPDGMEPFDFVKKADGSIYWDNNANDQSTTKSGETYLGKTLTYKFNSYIDAELWDGPGGSGPAGDKLTSTISLNASENANGELTGISASKIVKVGDTPVGTARDYYPGEGGSNNIFNFSKTIAEDGTLRSYNLNFEQHASVSKIEEIGLNILGYKIVDVAQKLNVTISNGNLSTTGQTNIFPSATLDLNNSRVFKYNQPSFDKTHNARTPVMSTYLPGQVQGYKSDFSYYPSTFYRR
jgi:RHS repeat-associated protein